MVKTLEIDWIEKSCVDVADGVDLAVDGDQRDAEEIRGHLGEGRDVVGVLALLEARVLGVRRLQRRFDVGLGRLRQRPATSRRTAAGAAVERAGAGRA